VTERFAILRAPKSICCPSALTPVHWAKVSWAERSRMLATAMAMIEEEEEEEAILSSLVLFCSWIA